jgi:hypothetical protein
MVTARYDISSRKLNREAFLLLRLIGLGLLWFRSTNRDLPHLDQFEAVAHKFVPALGFGLFEQMIENVVTRLVESDLGDSTPLFELSSFGFQRLGNIRGPRAKAHGEGERLALARFLSSGSWRASS